MFVSVMSSAVPVSQHLRFSNPCFLSHSHSFPFRVAHTLALARTHTHTSCAQTCRLIRLDPAEYRGNEPYTFGHVASHNEPIEYTAYRCYFGTHNRERDVRCLSCVEVDVCNVKIEEVDVCNIKKPCWCLSFLSARCATGNRTYQEQ